MKYTIDVQFVNNDAKFTEEAKAAVEDAITNYNSKSLISKNPKQIIEHFYSEDLITMTLVLESQAELPMPSKALRLMSSYLVEDGRLSHCLAHKQLFKMAPRTERILFDDRTEDPWPKLIDAVIRLTYQYRELNDIRSVKKYLEGGKNK